MADVTLEDIRKQYPQYDDMSDVDLAKGLHEKFYSDMPFNEFASKINLKGSTPEIKPDKYPTLAAAADIPLSVGRGAVNGIQMISDAFGANNPVSKTLSSVDTTLADLMSAQSKKDAQEIARIMDEAKDKGIYEQVKAGIHALTIAPVDLITNALGTAAPVVLAGLAATVGAPAVATAAGASAATAAAIGAGAGVATELGIGAISGAGTIKNRIYGDVYQALKDQQVPEEKAIAAAEQAQAYNGKNLDQILLGTLFGAGASVTGAEATLVKGMASKILKNTAETAATEAEKHVAKGIGGRFIEGAVKEAIPEAAQEAQEQVASNVAQQREGMDVPTFRGAATAATLAGVTGGVLGGGLDVALGHGPRTVDKNADRESLLNDLQTHQAGLQAERETPRLEDMSGNQRLALAEQMREKIPALGEILDSSVPRDVKLNLIDSQLRNAGLGNVENETINLKGVLSLPSPEIKKSENIRQVFNNALDIADKAGIPLGDLTINQGPEGYRLVSPDGQVMSDPMPKGTEREANIVLEGLRRTHDARQTEAYRAASDEYRQEFDQTMARVTAAAAREATTPLNPIPMSDIQGMSPDLANRIREGRRQSPTNMTNAEIEGPVTFDEMRVRGASREMLTDLAKDQQPYTAGTGKIVPDIEQELLASRPSKPVPTARTEEELARQKYATVTPVGSEEAEFSRAKKEQPSEEQQAFNEREGTAPVKPARPEREAYPEIPAAPRPSDEEIAQARQRIEDRIAKLEATGKQGEAIGKGVRDAVANSEFTPEQLVNAFQIADISARLLGKTEADPHALEFVQRIATPTGETAGGARIAPTEKLHGIIRMSLDPKYDVKSTSAHESFHILQDLFAAYDKAGAMIINNAFKGAKSFDDIDANLLRKLKSLRDPDTGDSVYDTLKNSVENKGLLEDYDQATREREMQAYVFGYMDNAITNGNQNMGGLGAAFVRFLNYFRQFKERVANYYKGLGYNTAEDVISATSRGERQAGLGVAGERVEKAVPGAAFDFSRAKNLSDFQKGNPSDIPNVVYHGTDEGDIRQFSGRPNWFSEDPYIARGYAPNNGGSIYPVHISMKKPLRIENFDMNDSADKALPLAKSLGLPRDYVSEMNRRYDNAFQIINDSAFIDAAEQKGFDGIIANEGGYKTFGTFLPTQIKSATGNIGNFDKTNPDIEFSRARKNGGQQVSTNLNDRDPTNRPYGLYPYLRSVATKVFDHPKMIMGTMNPGNAAKQIEALKIIRQNYPNPLQSEAKFAEMLSFALGKTVKDGTVPLVPYNAIKLANDPKLISRQIGGLSQGQIHMAQDGFNLGARFKRLYQNGQMTPEHTAKMILWGILSRGVSPFVQESAFMDIVTERGNKSGVGHFIQAALDGRFNMDDYLEWTSYVMPDNSPGNGTTHNLNAFGKTLGKLAEKLEDGRTVLETLHDAIKDYSKSGPEVRRIFHTINDSMGINNKVLSFVLLVTGRNDVLVLDRVQMRNLFNDGRFDNYNMYDGEKTKKTVQKRSGEEKEEDAADRGTSIAQLGNGAIGLLYYEALERGLLSSVRTAYNQLNRGNGSAGQYHWESWVASSAQEVDHGSIEGILRDAEGVVDPYFGVTTREGKFDTFNSGMIYGHDQKGNPYTELTDGQGNFFRFDPQAATAVLKDISNPSKGVIPKGFKVSQNETGPWFNNPEVNKERLRQLLSEAGTLVRGNATPFSQANTNVNGPVQRAAGANQPSTGSKAGEVEFSRAAAQTGDNVEEFKEWWGDSKAVTPDGQPMPYYHGTFRKFKKFDNAKSAAIKVAGVPQTGPFFFSPKPLLASDFAMTDMTKGGSGSSTKGGRVIPAFLSVQNPFDYENTSHRRMLAEEIAANNERQFDTPEKVKALVNEFVNARQYKEGMWNFYEPAAVQRAIRGLEFDGFYVKEGGIKNLAVFEPNQIKSVFNEFKPGTATSEEFSRAIAATKQEKEAEDNSKRHFQVWDKAREFFNPLALVNNLPQFLSFRNIVTGSVTTSEQYARKMADKIAKGSVEERQAVYTYMTTKNGDASTIKNPEIRKAAMEAKKAINDYAKIMVERGEMTQDSFDKYYDKYLPRIYLLYEATNRGMKTPMGGTSVREYLKLRDEDLSEDYRKILGEIKDPSYLTYVALSRPARDMAMTDYLNNLFVYGGDPKNQWIAPQSTVEYDGKKYTPYDLQHKADDLDSVAAIADNLSQDQANAMRKEASKMRQMAMSAQADLEYKLDAFKAKGYAQIPTRRQYGALAGAVVQKGIYQDLVGTFIPVGKENRSLIERILGDEHSTLGKATSLWKLGKTTLNPPTQVVNFVSNAIALNLFGGVPVHKFPDLFSRTLKEIMNNGKMWQEAQKFGISGGTMSKAELDRAFVRMKRYQAKAGGEGNLANMYATSRAIGSAFIEKAGDAYQFSESLFKMMMYIHSVENENMKPSDAVNAANDVLFDYSLVNNNIRWLRNAPLGLPFITYYYKALPKLIETLYKHPERFIPYFAMAYALPAMTMAAFDLNDDELEKLRKSTQDYVRDSGTMFFLPIRDSKGNIEFVDLGKYLPFSTFLSPFITAFKYGEYAKGAKELIQPITPSGPIVTVIEALGTGKDPFTGKPIMDPRDTNKAQALSMFSYIWNQAMPPIVGMDFNNPEKSSGALPRIYNSLFVDGTGVDKRGMPKPEALESAARLLGLNITPLKADVQRIQNINYMTNEINKTKALQAQIAKDQSLNPVDRTARIRELNEKIKDQMAEMQKYANETSNIGQITQKIREAK